MSRRLRVGLVVKTAEAASWTLPQVDELRVRGHEVVALLPAGDGSLRRALAQRGVPIVDSGCDFRFGPRPSTVSGLLALRRRIGALAPDVLLYHLYASALATRLASAGLGMPRVHMVAGPLYLDSWTIRLAERFLARLDTVTIAGSEFTAGRYRELGRPAGRTLPIPYGVDTDRFRPADPLTRKQARAELGVGPEDLLVIMVAYVYAPKRLVHAGRGIKGHDVLLSAWPRFHAQHPDSRLLLVGQGFDDAGERHRMDLIAQFRPEEHGVTWIGTAADVRRYYAAADLSVSPSLSDNHGAALEAGAMGLPSVVSDAGALPETVDDGCGWVVGADDPAALAAALGYAAAEHARGELPGRGMLARARVLRLFDAERSAKAVVDVVEHAANARPSGSERVIGLFTESRFGRDQAGRWAAGDAITGAVSWSRYTMAGSRVRLVARADPRSGTLPCALPDGLELAPLPHYVGLLGLLRSAPRLLAIAAREVARADVLLFRQPGAIGTAGALAAWVLRRRYAVEVIGDPYDVLRSGVLGRAGHVLAPAARAVMRAVVRGAEASRFVTRETLQRTYPPAPGSLSVGVASVHLDGDAYVAEPRRYRPGPFRVITVGSQEQLYKGHDVLLRAVRRLTGEGMEVTAVLVGGGRRQPVLVELAASLGIADLVTFAGQVHDRRRLLGLLDEGSVFAFPSLTEGLPRALLEAMARALPVVGSAVGGIPELIDAPWLVPAGDDAALAERLRALLLDRSAWEEQSARNLERAKDYELSRIERRFHAWLAGLPDARRG